MRAASLALPALLSLGCAGPSPAGATASPGPAGGAPRVLFVGNSLTEGHALPRMVESLARAAGQPLAVEAVTFGGFSLEDHWNQGDARRAIARGGWRYVVLQQGPSSLAASRANLVEWTRRFDGEIRRAGARPVLFAVWPESARAAAFDDVTRSYAEAASAVDGLLLPAGEAWRAAWRRQPALELYGTDGFHPTPRGTYLAALVIAAQLLGRSAAGLARDVHGAGVPEVRLSASERALFESAAAEAIGSVTGASRRDPARAGAPQPGDDERHQPGERPGEERPAVHRERAEARPLAPEPDQPDQRGRETAARQRELQHARGVAALHQRPQPR